ncbi:hypothetical protein [Vreelandella nanhaiensis]|uniref:Uncharacterized protein n=1 Tax=Vreelandella nanhaiensis TaxID=1258546 RepID=A0A433KVA4_9GAMM|nr:hypothetical protein [Halomonas nanhaiensis]RUR33619.1 hypothetical protein ELY38_04120 [Halomonas nanhaiensis]
MPYQKQAFTAVIYPKLSHAGLCILTLLLWCATPPSSFPFAAGANNSSNYADQRESLLPVAMQDHSLRVRSSKALPVDTSDQGAGEAALPAHVAPVDIARTGGCALPLTITPWANNPSGCLPPIRAPPAT